MNQRLRFIAIAIALLIPEMALAVVNYDKGRRIVKGIQLLQDADDPAAYYYLPTFPRLSTNEKGDLEFVCLKFVGGTAGTNGGLFHALVEFTLAPEVVADLEKELRKDVPGARIVGPVPMMQATPSADDAIGSFQVVSATLADVGTDKFTRSVITSGKAPLTPGSKAALAAILNESGANLLWESMKGGTSDVSIAIHAYYEAAVQGYNARVTADVETVYQHFSNIANVQEGYTKNQVRKVIDDLQRTQALKIDVFDRSLGLGIKAADMEAILQVVTDKLIELMFDHTSGWSKDPDREVAVEAGQVKGRQDRGWFSEVFGGAQDTPYYTDNQYVLKRRTDIRHNVFAMTLSKSTTIKVPVDTAGNLGGLYKALGQDPRYFRVISMDSPDFQIWPIRFLIDNEFAGSFDEAFNFVSVTVRKAYADRPAFTKPLTFSYADVKKGTTVQQIDLPRLGMSGEDWMEFEYQIRWAVRDGPTISVPANEGWIRSRDPSIALSPPIEKREILISADHQLFSQRGISTVVVEFATLLGGKAKLQRKTELKAADPDQTKPVVLYHDRGTQIAVRVSWHGAGIGNQPGKLEVLDSDYLFLDVPQPAQPGGTDGVHP